MSSSWTNVLLYKLVLPKKIGLALQPIMGPAAGPMACWTSVFFRIRERFSPPAHDGSSSWTNGLLGKFVLPNRSGLVCSPLSVQQLDQWHAGQACSSPLGAVWSSSPLWVQQLDQCHAGQACSFQSGSGLILRPTMGPAAGRMACWTILFFPVRERFNPPARYGSSSWTNGLLDKLVLPSPLWVQQLDQSPAGQACSSQ